MSLHAREGPHDCGWEERTGGRIESVLMAGDAEILNQKEHASADLTASVGVARKDTGKYIHFRGGCYT